MVTKPLISILTPVYNQEHYFEKTINSVLYQTYQNWEWIIIDDGSTDNTRKIINTYKDERIKYFYQEHSGIDKICSTHNKALWLSKGDFIALIDGDDLWPEDKLEKQLQSFINDEVILSYGECYIINSEGKKIDYNKVPNDKEISRNEPLGASLQEFLFKATSFIYNPTVLIKKSALQRIGGFIEYRGLCHDFPTWCRLSLDGKFDPVSQCLGYWRKHNNSVTFYNAEYRFRNKIQFIKDFTEKYKREIESLGFYFIKENIDMHIDKRLQSFIEFLPYDKAILMAKIGMFQEAREEFSIYAKKNPSLKNQCIYYLFYLSKLLNYDIVNPVRKMKENLDTVMKNM